KVITERPQRVSLVRPTVTPQMEAAIDCALAKLPADRFATAEEFVDALRGKRAVAVPSGIITPASASSDVAIRARRTRRALRAAALVLIGFVGGALAMRLARERPRVAQPMRFQLREPDSIQFRNPPQVTMAISPDGSRVVWSARAGPTV